MEYQLDNDVNVDISNNNQTIILSENFFYPNFIDYRDFCLPTNNQGNKPHCVGYTISGYFEVEYWKRFHIPRQISALKIYMQGRKYNPNTVVGTRLEYCLEQLKNDKVFDGEIRIVENVQKDTFKYITHQNGCIMCAFMITNEWYKLNDNIIKKKSKPKKLGGHCVLGCGYNKDGVYIQNSWGYEKWGNYGFAIIPWNLFCEQIQYCVFIENFSIDKEKMENFINAKGC